MYSLRCDKCGWQEEMDSVLYTSCPHCHTALIIENYGEDIEPSMLTPEKELQTTNRNKEVKYMRTLITSVGNNTMWIGIENKSDYKERIKYRKLFLLAGGIIPKEKLI